MIASSIFGVLRCVFGFQVDMAREKVMALSKENAELRAENANVRARPAARGGMVPR